MALGQRLPPHEAALQADGRVYGNGSPDCGSKRKRGLPFRADPIQEESFQAGAGSLAGSTLTYEADEKFIGVLEQVFAVKAEQATTPVTAPTAGRRGATKADGRVYENGSPICESSGQHRLPSGQTPSKKKAFKPAPGPSRAPP